MPSQDDRPRARSGQGPLTWLQRQAPALQPLLAGGQKVARILWERTEEYARVPLPGPWFAGEKHSPSPPGVRADQPRPPFSGPLFPGDNATRTLPETMQARGQTPVSGPFFPGGNATRTLPETTQARGQMPGQVFFNGNATRTLPETVNVPGQAPVSGQLPPPLPGMTGALPGQTRLQSWPPVPTSQLSEGATQRVPVVIKASMKKPTPAPPPLPPDLHKKRRMQMTLVGLVLLGLITLLALFTVTPLGHEVGLDSLGGSLNGRVLTGQNPGVSNPIAQATATAIYHRRTDGYDPSFFGSQLIGDGRSSLVWPLGQCTYWSNYEYHRLTGYWVSWNGNADQWVTGAHKAGWNVSQTPHVPSIMVMMPRAQGASGYGHVAVVEGVSGNVVHTSNMNWWSNGGGWNRVSNVDFVVGSGIYFIWHT